MVEVEIEIQLLEREHKRSLKNYSAEELFAVFPEGRQLVPEKISEYEEEKHAIQSEINSALFAVLETKPNEFEFWFAKELISSSYSERLQLLDYNLKKLYYYRRFLQGKPTGLVDNSDIETANEVPIETLLTTKIRRNGNRSSTVCPLHVEKSASFMIFHQTNKWRCFGCNKFGGVIDLAMAMNNLTFRQAVQYLLS